MRTCKEVVRLLSSGEDLGPACRLELWFHRLICEPCRLYKRQLASMSRLYRQWARTEADPGAERCRALEDRILEDLQKKKS